jgi:hypothetical protein
MQKLNKMETDTTRLQRRFLVLGSSLMVLWFWIEGFVFLWFHTSGTAGYAATWIVTAAAIISFLCQYRLYRLNATRIVSVPDKDIDERQKMVRDQAYRHAYKISIGLVLITLTVIIFPIYLYQNPAGFILPTIGLIWAMILLPTWVVAWTEQGI